MLRVRSKKVPDFNVACIVTARSLRLHLRRLLSAELRVRMPFAASKRSPRTWRSPGERMAVIVDLQLRL
jgi:hypothetical protein